MAKAVLPRGEVNTSAAEWIQVYEADKALREAVNNIDGEQIEDGAITREKLASTGMPFTWYTPKIIATEESRTNTEYGKLGTADEVANVVLPANGLIFVGFFAQFKSSVSGNGSAAIFLNSTQLKIRSVEVLPQAAPTETSNNWYPLTSSGSGLISYRTSSNVGEDVTTGQVVAANPAAGYGGVIPIFAAAGTYSISVQFKAISGSVTAKNRKLWAYTLGY